MLLQCSMVQYDVQTTILDSVCKAQCQYCVYVYPRTVNRTALRCRAFKTVRDGFETDEDNDSEYFNVCKI